MQKQMGCHKSCFLYKNSGKSLYIVVYQVSHSCNLYGPALVK